jgi:hypothetical protein
MHDGHHHDHPHDHSHDHGPGHNHAVAPRRAVQWQAPHLVGDTTAPQAAVEPDLDLVESAFAEGFQAASDPTSFLRVAQVKFSAQAPDGASLSLLRVEIDDVTDTGSLTPHLGGGSFRYDPLPARMVTRRKRLRFVYFDGKALRALTLAEVRALA